MLYHPNSPYYRQFLSASAKTKKKQAEMIVNQATQKAAANLPSSHPSSVGL